MIIYKREIIIKQYDFVLFIISSFYVTQYFLFWKYVTLLRYQKTFLEANYNFDENYIFWCIL